MARTPLDAGDPLQRYTSKRDFRVTPEPKGRRAVPAKQLSFVIQKHWASRLHYDFRLELDGVLMSWALPKGPSYDPKEKRMAVHVEDHPVSYGSFEGTIPPKQYGAGTVIVWDRGTWEPVGDPRDAMSTGKLLFKLHGEKLAGLWELVRIAKPGDKQDPWMLFKKRDAWARPSTEYDVIAALPDSVIAKPLGLIEEREPREVLQRTPQGQEGPDLSKAVKAALPKALSPQLATLAGAPPTSGDWVIENKFDGYRLLARVDMGRAALITRGGHDWTVKMPALAAAVEALGIRSAWLDGEIVVLNERGVPDFNRLQNAIDSTKSGAISYFVFDAPYLEGKDLRQVPLRSRRAELQRRLGPSEGSPVRFSEDFPAEVSLVVQAACELGLEGVMLKRGDSPYVSGRTETWLKLKCQLRQEFVVCGFTARSGAKSEVGSLLLGYHEEGALRYAGSVGTGWDSKTGRVLRAQLEPLEVAQAPFDPQTAKPGRWSKRAAGAEQWVRPELVAEVAFSEWTPEGHVRHATFKGLRTDKAPTAITREGSTARPLPVKRPAVQSQVKVTHPERVVDPATGLKKLDVVRYYESIAEWMLPHLKGRPVSLVRAPEGIAGQLFFQKHPETRMPGLTVLDPKLWPRHAALLSVDDAGALVSAAQMNVIEFHTWNSTVKQIDKPDRVIFDLDPGEGVKWEQVQEAALLMRGMLTELGLCSWLKTSGGKGLHVVVPLTPKFDYDTVKSWSQAVVQHLAKTLPQRFVAKSGPANRVGKVFVDYLRNGHAQTTAAAYSARSRPGLGVSMPVSWERLMELKSASQWTVATAREYVSFQSRDPWADYWTQRQSLAASMKRLAVSPTVRPGSAVRRLRRVAMDGT